jgi:gamma-glutamylcyclotransferase (GGCT)/AIG2-like uncharacterized protein YtfP
LIRNAELASGHTNGIASFGTFEQSHFLLILLDRRFRACRQSRSNPAFLAGQPLPDRDLLVSKTSRPAVLDGSKRSLLFVYGSLKRDQPNHQVLGPSAVYLGEARTRDEYRLLDLGEYPALAGGGTASITGELFAVSDEMFEVLDGFEGGEYVRSTLVLADGRSAFVYVATETVSRRAVSTPATAWSSQPPRR